VSEAGIVKINNLKQLQKELTQNFSNYNDSSSESCQDRSFSEVYLLLLTQSLVRLQRHTHTPKCNESAKIRANHYCRLTILIVSLFSLCRLRITTQHRSGAVDKMGGILQNAFGNPAYVNQMIKLRKKLEGPKGGLSKNLGGPWSTQAPLRIATV